MMNTKTELEAQVEALKSQLIQARTLQEIGRDLNMARNEMDLLRALAQPALSVDAAEISLAYVDLDDMGRPAYLEVVAMVAPHTASGSLANGTAATEAVAQPDESALIGIRLRWKQHAPARLWEAHPDTPTYIADAKQEEALNKAVKTHMARLGLRAEVAIPLRQAERWVGVILYDWREPHTVSDFERAIFDALPALVTPVVENQRLVERLEKIVEARTTELRENQFLFQTFLDNFPDLAFAKDLEGHFILSNRALERTFEASRGNLIGRTIYDFVPEETADGMWATERRVLETGKPMEVEHVTHDHDNPRIKWLVEFPLYDADGKIYAVGGIATDITERKEAEAEQARLQQETLMAQQEALKELATPIIPVMDRIIVMPLVGHVDSLRARDIMRSLLAGITEHRAKVVILDVTGVSIIDTGIVNHLNKTIQAARLKGAHTIVTGLSDAVAETIVDLGIDWGDVETLSELRTGLLAALRTLGYRVCKIQRPQESV